ncbi:hypothetical protein KPL78_28465 [Roseomonas sp. HJA6]|uniref:MFS transporter n=2 Tax=Roseomonas alba TaxID=2846776 RepID=A0ABS7AHM8_9PROT|nr:hypothetical protein [Neoroseomonas alba]
MTMLALTARTPLTLVIGLVPITETLGSGKPLPSLASSLACLGSGLGGVICGMLAVRFWQRAVAMLGGAAIVSGLTLALSGKAIALTGIGFDIGLFGNGA